MGQILIINFIFYLTTFPLTTTLTKGLSLSPTQFLVEYVVLFVIAILVYPASELRSIA